MSDAEFFASAWFKSRPPAVQAAFRKYTGQKISLEGFEEYHYLTGVTENIETGQCGLWVSATDPEMDYDRARATEFKVCSCCMKRVHIPSP
jgi:hypothetical protein